MSNLYLIINTNLYTGNFERELMAFVFGIYDGDERSEAYADDELSIFETELDNYDFDLQDEIWNTYDESRRGRVYSEYHGYFIGRAPGEKECNAIYMAVNKKFSDKVFEIIKEKMSRFEQRISGLKILDMSYYEETYQRVD